MTTNEQSIAMPLRVLARLYSEPWAIEAGALSTITRIVSRAGDGPDVLAALLGRPLEGSRRSMVTSDGVAVIPVFGPIVPRADMMQDISGAVSLASFTKDLDTALADDSVSAILLEIDSPGGVAAGLHDVSVMVRAASARKPLEVFASGMMASAAYWLGSAASRITVAADVLVGSIGVVGAVQVQIEADQAGRMTTEIVSSSAPNKRPDPRTDEGRAALQGHIDAMEAVFLADVAGNRDVSVEFVKSEFGAGGLFVGAQAVAAGMADAVGTFEEVAARLAGAADVSETHEPAPGSATIEGNDAMPLSSLTAESLNAERADLVAEIAAAAATAERDRIGAILEVAAKSPASADLVTAAINDPKADAGSLALSILRGNADRLNTLGLDVQADASAAVGAGITDLSAVSGGEDLLEGDGSGESLPPMPAASVMGGDDDLDHAAGDPDAERKLDARRFRASADLQNLYGTEADYCAYVAGQRSRGLPIN